MLSSSHLGAPLVVRQLSPLLDLRGAEIIRLHRRGRWALLDSSRPLCVADEIGGELLTRLQRLLLHPRLSRRAPRDARSISRFLRILGFLHFL